MYKHLTQLEKTKLIIKTKYTKNKIFLTLLFASAVLTLPPCMNSPCGG